MEQAELNQLMSSSAADAVKITAEEFNITLDYSVASISLLDDVLLSFIDRYQEEAQTDQALFTLANIYGAYMGEVYKKEYGGEWYLADSETSSVMLTLGEKSFAFAGICYERLAKDQKTSVLKYFALAAG